MTPAQIYAGSDGEATKALYAELEKRGPAGVIALNLFRACKASVRAKVYRRRFKGAAYEKKNWSLGLLCQALSQIAGFQSNCSTPGCGYADGKPCINCGFVVSHGVRLWGWKEDPAQEFHKWVLYIDLPTGQVSFHSAAPITTHRPANISEGLPNVQHLSVDQLASARVSVGAEPAIRASAGECGAEPSFHRYAGDWDGTHLSAERIVAYTEAILAGTPPEFVPSLPNHAHAPNHDHDHARSPAATAPDYTPSLFHS